ncbi:MAG: hypothetical protein ACUVS4_04780 [Chloroflexaceae bacterium]
MNSYKAFWVSGRAENLSSAATGHSRGQARSGSAAPEGLWRSGIGSSSWEAATLQRLW